MNKIKKFSNMGITNRIWELYPFPKLTTFTMETRLDRSIVGSLRYLVNSRPDLAFSVGMVSRFMESPNFEHWVAIKRIIRYVAGTTELGCKFVKGKNSELLGYTDSDHAGDIEKRKSTTGIAFFLGGNLVTWSSQKQRVVSLSSCES
jgi:hypothetical protein